MPRYIDVSNLPNFEVSCSSGKKYVLLPFEHLSDIPTADVVQVVRCKDCKYLYCLSVIDRRFYCRHFPRGLTGINIVEDNPFCSYGERKEE